MSRPAAELQPLYDQFVADVDRRHPCRRGRGALRPPRVRRARHPRRQPGVRHRGARPRVHRRRHRQRRRRRSTTTPSRSSSASPSSRLNDVIESLTAGLGVPSWGGEYGFWDTDAATLARAQRYAADEDRRAWGGAWWQWRQSCGDPHAVRGTGTRSCPTTAPRSTSTSSAARATSTSAPTTRSSTSWAVATRGGARAHRRARQRPGHRTPAGARPRATAAGGELVVWTPTADDAEHRCGRRGPRRRRRARRRRRPDRHRPGGGARRLPARDRPWGRRPDRTARPARPLAGRRRPPIRSRLQPPMPADRLT